MGPVFFGTPLQTRLFSSFIYDTGSGWLVVKDNECVDCDFTYYDHVNSASYSKGYSNYYNDELNYGSASLKGYVGSDKVCLTTTNPDTCSENFGFFQITEETGLDGLDGILGFSPAVTNNGPSFMKSLHEDGKIDKMIASFFLSDADNKQSKASNVLLGGMDSEYYTGDVRVHDVDQKYNSWWSLEMTGLGINWDNAKSTKVSLAVIDTGTSLMYVPRTEFDVFVSRWKFESGDVRCFTLFNPYCYSSTKKCAELAPKLASIQVELDHVTYSMPAEAYLLPQYDETTGLEDMCLFSIWPIDDDQNLYLIGDTFLRQFYSSYDYQNNTISFAVSVNAREGVEITDKKVSTMSGWAVFGIVCACLFVLVLLFVLVKKCTAKKSDHVETQYQAQYQPAPGNPVH